MFFQTPFLRKINRRNEAAFDEDVYIFYDLEGGIYQMSVKDYPEFALQWIGASKPPSLTMDLASARIHSVILDLDHQRDVAPDGNTNIGIVIESILKMTLIPSIPNFTYVIAMRARSKGIHVHLPELEIGHDDYVLLCESLQYKFRRAMMGKENYKLDVLTNAMLPGAAKPNASPYVPTRMVYVDERNTFAFNLLAPEEDAPALKKKFVKRKDNENSVFRNILNCNPKMLRAELRQLMMPVVVVVGTTTQHTLAYATSIGKSTCTSDWRDVARFTYRKSKERGVVGKSTKLEFVHPVNALKVYHHLKLNGPTLTDFETNNHAIKTWAEQFVDGDGGVADSRHVPELFRELHETLRFEHSTLAEDPNPVKTVMQFNEGYHFLPAFYALCRHYRLDSAAMARELYPLLDEPFHPLLDKIRAIHPKNVSYAMTEISINTLHFCANNLHEERPKTNREKLRSIVENNRRAVLSVTTQDQMVDLIRSIQDRHLPIRVLKLKNALKKPGRFIWNALTESWQEVHMASEISDHMQNLWNHVKQFLNEYRASGGMGGPDEELVSRFSVLSVVSAIMSDTTMERKDIQMDTHKWFLRLRDGVLDLLTGHIGGVVPEFFLSDRKLNLGIPRADMMRLCNDSPGHVALYEKLTDKMFFLGYLRELFSDRTDGLYDTLRELVVGSVDELAESMMHFYINLCKCTSFDYDLFMYMMSVLASVYIGTNYERKFFVWKGLTRNGKSKLFELMGRVLGGYYHSIQSENLAPGHSANNATPELASTLFSCRMVTSEELEKKIDENRVKQITGNSFVAFRNMYEQNSGGIPTAKLFVTTNNYPECKASEAFKDRVVAIPFDAEFVDAAPSTTSEQVGSNTYPKDVYVVEQSFAGCFFMLYYHLKKFVNLEDGLLHYPPEPEYVVEFTNDYLIHADIYAQFKLCMDVQLLSGSMTTMNDVKSAVRQYLKTTRNTSFHESDLFICFEKEFGHLRRTDVNLGIESFNYTSIVDAPPAAKKTKNDNESLFVFYEGVVIKNLRRSSNADG